MIRQYFSTTLGKTVQRIAQLRGGGSALPGLVVEKIDPGFIKRSLTGLTHGVVLVSGTNGKTTTTKMIVELLEGQGLKVFTNRTGSNFTRGVVAALLHDMSPTGTLDADIAVLELDEAHAVHFVRTVAPTHSLLLNVMRDQLDRFGEIDHTASLLKTIAQATTTSVTLNREDERVRAIADSVAHDVSVAYFGLADELRAQFPTDDTLHGGKNTAHNMPADVKLTRFSGNTATFEFDSTLHSIVLSLNGIYNIFNAAAAITTVRQILGTKTNTTTLMTTLSHITPAFGRGETITVQGQPLELVLVKNPSGFRLGLSSFAPDDYATMIAINDNYADGRDMSWLWDVSFESLHTNGVSHVTGSRCYDMALRLKYDDVACTYTSPNITLSLQQFIAAHPDTPKRIYCTYTAMLAIRKEISHLTQTKGVEV